MSSKSIHVIVGVRVSFRVGLEKNPLHVCFLFEIRSIMIGAWLETEDMARGTRRVESQEPIAQAQKRRGESRWRLVLGLQPVGWSACGFWLNWLLDCQELLGALGRMRRLCCRFSVSHSLSLGFVLLLWSVGHTRLWVTQLVIPVPIGRWLLVLLVLWTHFLFFTLPGRCLCCCLCLVFRKEKSPGETLAYLLRSFQELNWLCNNLTF